VDEIKVASVFIKLVRFVYEFDMFWAKTFFARQPIWWVPRLQLFAPPSTNICQLTHTLKLTQTFAQRCRTRLIFFPTQMSLQRHAAMSIRTLWQGNVAVVVLSHRAPFEGLHGSLGRHISAFTTFVSSSLARRQHVNKYVMLQTKGK